MLYTIERRRITPHKLYGLVVAESATLLLLQRQDDFEFDGYVVVRKSDVTKSCFSEADAYCEKVMRKEGLWKTPSRAVRALPLDNWEALCRALVGKVVILENERRESFWIGPVVECDARAVVVHFFGVSGNWMNLERVQYRSITTLRFGDRYSTIHAKHLRGRPSTEGSS